MKFLFYSFYIMYVVSIKSDEKCETDRIIREEEVS